MEENEEDTDNAENTDLGTILAFSVGVPLSVLFTTIAAGYYVRNHKLQHYQNHQYEWLLWVILAIPLLVVASILWAFAGIIWFLFETVIIALLFESYVTTPDDTSPGYLQKHSDRLLTGLTAGFVILIIVINNVGSKIVNTLESDRIFLDLMNVGFFLVLITIWGHYFYWRDRKVEDLSRRALMLAKMLIIAMLILYFEVIKGLLRESQISWVSTISVGVEFLTPIILFVVAILNLTQDIVQYVDLDLSLPDFNINLPNLRNPYEYILGIYVLYLSKFFYEDLLGIGIAFLYAAIIFTFVSIIGLNYRLRHSNSIGQKT